MNMKTISMKYFIYCAMVSIFLFTLLYQWNKSDKKSFIIDLIKSDKSVKNMKNILIWTSPASDPIINFGKGQETFINNKCSITNCYVSSNRSLLKDVTEFDVILFHGPELSRKPFLLPQSRSPHQKYVFVSMESSAYYPICEKKYRNYFNWTWTYKLKSDEYYGYIVIRNKEGKVIGPKEEMHWEKIEAMTSIDDALKTKLSTKKIAAAWFVSNCAAPSGRGNVAKALQSELAKYNMTVDIYGSCGTKTCPTERWEECLQKVERDYYFYLSFENSFSEDYVTEKLLHALNHYAVPVVYGGANYTRFMPDGIYLSAQTQSIEQLAKEMVDIINDKQKYYNFFKWHNHYSYHSLDEPDTNPYCKFCAEINNEQFLRKSVYDDFGHWWNPPNRC